MNNINKEIVTITMATTLMLIIMITITIRKNYWNDTINNNNKSNSIDSI